MRLWTDALCMHRPRSRVSFTLGAHQSSDVRGGDSETGRGWAGTGRRCASPGVLSHAGRLLQIKAYLERMHASLARSQDSKMGEVVLSDCGRLERPALVWRTERIRRFLDLLGVSRHVCDWMQPKVVHHVLTFLTLDERLLHVRQRASLQLLDERIFSFQKSQSFLDRFPRSSALAHFGIRASRSEIGVQTFQALGAAFQDVGGASVAGTTQEFFDDTLLYPVQSEAVRPSWYRRDPLDAHPLRQLWSRLDFCFFLFGRLFRLFKVVQIGGRRPQRGPAVRTSSGCGPVQTHTKHAIRMNVMPAREGEGRLVDPIFGEADAAGRRGRIHVKRSARGLNWQEPVVLYFATRIDWTPH